MRQQLPTLEKTSTEQKVKKAREYLLMGVWLWVGVYSYLSASIGCMLAAFLAGYQPKVI